MNKRTEWLLLVTVVLLVGVFGAFLVSTFLARDAESREVRGFPSGKGDTVRVA